MTETVINNLKLARATLDVDIEKAISYYELVYNEMPENLEAKWFYLFGLVARTSDNEAIDNYNKLYQIFYPALEYVATFEEGREKQSIVATMIQGFTPLYDILYERVITNLWKTSLVEFVQLMPEPLDKKKLAEDILRIFGDEKPYCLLAVGIWKELIAVRFRYSEYRNFQDRGKELWFDELAKRIKVYDPTYEMPQFKQAGCISFGDKAKEASKVKPGE